LRRVKASELVPNPKNWRRHPKEQSAAMRGLLNEIGYAGALLARELPDGKLQLIDGHLRLETTPKATVPVLVLDVTEAEADKILLTFDPISAMANSVASATVSKSIPATSRSPSNVSPPSD
jgi:ParB-like nuclease domain